MRLSLVSTKKREAFKNEATQFSDWLRHRKEIDSSKGYVATDIDYMWTNYKTGEWMLIEEKRWNSDVTWCQKEQFKIIHKACKEDPNYKGIHLLQFERTCPEDGKIYLNRKEITKSQLISFLQNFNKDV